VNIRVSRPLPKVGTPFPAENQSQVQPSFLAARKLKYTVLLQFGTLWYGHEPMRVLPPP